MRPAEHPTRVRTMAIVALVGLVLNACSSRPAGSAGPTGAPSASSVRFTFAAFGGGGAQLTWMVRTARAWAADHPEINLTTTTGNFYAKPVPYQALQEAYFASPAPDVVAGFIGGSMTADAASGRFADLTDLWQSLGLDDAIPRAIADLAMVNGHRYWIPTLAQWNPVFYRTDVFASATIEPPATWDELLADCRALRSAGIDRPIAQAGGQSWSPPAARWFSTVDLAMNGADFHEALAAGRVAWTDPRVKAVFAKWKDLFDAGCYGDPALQAYGDPILELKSGSTAMDNLGEWIFENAALTNDLPIDFFRPPVIDPAVPRTDIVLAYGLAIPADSAHPEQAAALIRALVSADSLRTAYQTVPRVILDTRVDPGYLPRHARGLQLLEDADRVVELWEFTATEPQATIGLSLFTAFLQNPTTLGDDLAVAEQARMAAYGSARAGS